jgi:hypothetical protein
MQPEAITSMAASQLLAFIRVKDGTNRPALLEKIRPFDERRFRGLFTPETRSIRIS